MTELTELTKLSRVMDLTVAQTIHALPLVLSVVVEADSRAD